MQKITKDVLDKIREYIEHLCEIDEENVEYRIKEIPKIRHELFTRFSHECRELDNLNISLKKKYGDLYKHYKYEDDRNWDTKGEIESQIYSNKDYCTMWRIYNEQKYIVKELEGILENLKSLSYDIKELNQLIRFKSGCYH